MTEPQYRIVEIFQSMQGEGYNSGMAAVFIRFGKCNLACSWCDTDYLRFNTMSLSAVVQQVQNHTAANIIITGGEPTIQPQLETLLDALKACGYYLCIETNGLMPVPAQIDYIAASPKACYAAKYAAQCIEHADEVRIVADGDVTAFARSMAARIRARHYYLSPLDTEGSMNIGHTLQQLGALNQQPAPEHWQLSVQAHKWAGIE
ncbi:7-carboxy-7-deazaguanine synthase QueE [Paralysiella testudinis]|uniref:7-carboxy-7-deazaguanine synthase n=1 Tax=Paralysiella testudinis TaxID=2809020 RepID=A0A892ZQ42_9NEIS|nr:7-carboxy-7-deazaguanine synthase QueE [Paralysiella testudinis]QRQ82929.1 7-carboxy-7-deazaguanine synthase QueE [Paralysiella testudinis]